MPSGQDDLIDRHSALGFTPRPRSGQRTSFDDRQPITAAIRTPPAGATLLAALVPDDADVSVVDMLGGDRIDFDEPTDLVGITTRTPVACVAYQVADRFRDQGVTVVLGGPHASAVPLDALEHADAVVVGEAEKTWPRLLADFGAGDLKPFYVCGPMRFDPGARAVHHEPELPSLSGLPLARRDLVPPERYAMDTVLTTRGCPYDCSFCPVPDLFGRKLRHRPVSEVVAEVDTLRFSYFNLDDNVLGLPGDEDYYLDLFGELAELGRRRTWTGQAGLGVLERSQGREVLRRAVESGLATLSIGVESVSQSGLSESGACRKLSTSGRDRSLDKMREQIRIVQDHGVFVVGWFVIGWDSDGPDAYRRSLDFADETGIAPVIVNLLPMPGTRCYDELLQAGRMKPGLTWNDYRLEKGGIVYSHPIMSEDEMITSCRRAVQRGYSAGRVLRRSVALASQHPALGLVYFVMGLLGQRGLKRAFGG
jgi:radical SAM superfamily enzyme YgiQ (UPF0313 family)